MAIDFNRPVTKDMLQSMRQLRQKQRAAGIPINSKPIINAHYGQHTGWDTALDAGSNFINSAKTVSRLVNPVQRAGAQTTEQLGKVFSKLLSQTADKGSSGQNIKAYLQGVNDLEHAKQYLAQDLIDSKTDTIGKLSPQKNAQLRKKYNQWAKRYKYYGGEPSLAKWLSLHTSQTIRNAQNKASQQADKESGSGQGMRTGIQDIGNQQMAGNSGIYVAGLFSPKAREGAQDAVRAGKRHLQNLQKVRKMPAAQQISYFSTTAAPAAAAAGTVVAAPYIATTTPWVAKNLVLPSIGYSAGQKAAQPFTDWYNKDLRAVADALTTRDVSNLTKPQQVIFDKIKEQYLLGDTPDTLWDSAAKALYNKAGHNEKLIKTVVSTAPTLVSGKGFVSRAVMSPVWGYLNYRGIQPSTTAAQDVLQGNISQEDKAQMQAIADAHGVPLTRKVQTQLYNMGKTKEQQQGLLQKGIGLVTGSKWGQSLVHSGIQSNINDLVNFGGMDAKQQKEALPELLQNMKSLASTPWKLNALAAYTNNKNNMQGLVKSFDKYSPQQLGNLYDAVKQIQKQNNGLVPPQVQKLQAMLQQAAQTSAVTKYSAGLSQTDPQKFQAHMKSWMPLFHKITSQNQWMSQQFKALRDRTQKAVWAHVKKNPFFINKAMSIWAMSNGFNSLADFLGSNGAFYGTLGAIGIGLPLTISLIKSLFGGSSTPQQVVQQAPMQGYQPMAYAPKGITERGLIVG